MPWLDHRVCIRYAFFSRLCLRIELQHNVLSFNSVWFCVQILQRERRCCGQGFQTATCGEDCVHFYFFRELYMTFWRVIQYVRNKMFGVML